MFHVAGVTPGVGFMRAVDVRNCAELGGTQKDYMIDTSIESQYPCRAAISDAPTYKAISPRGADTGAVNYITDASSLVGLLVWVAEHSGCGLPCLRSSPEKEDSGTGYVTEGVSNSSGKEGGHKTEASQVCARKEPTSSPADETGGKSQNLRVTEVGAESGQNANSRRGPPPGDISRTAIE